uniref:Uncharacterized protein n=1 Tax=Anguilla anguilla TaxID=7936 RepID=A0A0E9VMX4_ANGAN
MINLLTGHTHCYISGNLVKLIAPLYNPDRRALIHVSLYMEVKINVPLN